MSDRLARERKGKGARPTTIKQTFITIDMVSTVPVLRVYYAEIVVIFRGLSSSPATL
eukprot:m.33310 g.33310  ORF g.33310 m.33310 type:complete len:57 (+) comp7179_c0_seq1:2522-2692(+)